MSKNKFLPAMMPLFFGAAGIIIAAIVQTLYTNGYFVTAFATMGVTITEVMILIIAVWVLVGIVAAVVWS
jgi:hypothetical protein